MLILLYFLFTLLQSPNLYSLPLSLSLLCSQFNNREDGLGGHRCEQSGGTDLGDRGLHLPADRIYPRLPGQVFRRGTAL